MSLITTAGRSLFEAARKALEHFIDWYRPQPTADTILRIEVKMTEGNKTFYVRAGRIVEFYKLDAKKWLAPGQGSK
jgi:hypothetical protein